MSQSIALSTYVTADAGASESDLDPEITIVHHLDIEEIDDQEIEEACDLVAETELFAGWLMATLDKDEALADLYAHWLAQTPIHHPGRTPITL